MITIFGRQISPRTIWTLAYILLVGIACWWLFSPAAGYWSALRAPDDAPFKTADWFANRLDDFLDGTQAISPFGLFQLIDPIGRHELSYILCTLLFGGGMVYYLRSLRLPWPATVGGGLFIAFSGYFFTLFNAGHLGLFFWASTYMWTFGLLNRALQGGRNLLHYALLGVVMAWGQVCQADLWLLGTMFLGFYALWRLRLHYREWKVWLPRFLLTGVIALIVMSPSLKVVLTSTLASRDAQIAGMPQVSDQATDRWFFATGWSLPPKESIEFAVGSYFGNDSFREPHPYWGALGRPRQYTPECGVPNYRQHGTYIGLVALLLMGLAIGSFFQKSNQPTTSEDRDKRLTDDRPFWCVVWVIALLLAFGRNAPFYQYFYKIPYMDYLRAPVKFLHFTEIATAVLAAYGLTRLLECKLRWWIVSVPIFAMLACGALAISTHVRAPQLIQEIQQLGFGERASNLVDFAVATSWRATLLALIVAGTYLIAVRGRRTLAVCILIIVGLVDLTGVASRYVDIVDVQHFHVPNSITKAMLRQTNGYAANVACYASNVAWGRDPLSTNLRANGFNHTIPDCLNHEDPTLPVLKKFGNNLVPHWDYTGTRFLVVTPDQARQLGQHLKGLRPIFQSQQVVVLQREIGVRYPILYGTNKMTTAGITMTAQRGKGFSRTTSGKVMVPDGGAKLVLPMHWDERLGATIDGKKAQVLQENELWCALSFPAGEHTFSIARRCTSWLNALSLSVSLALMIGAGAIVLRRKE